MANGVENPAVAMQVIRQALTVLYSGEVVDIASSTDLVWTLPSVMDRALAGSACPFQTYEESLLAFARAIYALQLEGGRCTTPGNPAGCGLYDPDHLYVDPQFSTISYAGTDVQLSDEIGSSFGIDFVDVMLDPAADGRPLTLALYPAPGTAAEFHVQILTLMAPGEGARPRRVPDQTTAPEVLVTASEGGRLVYIIPAIDMAAYNRLGLIITRADTRESSDPVSAYTIVLHGDAGNSP
jgi:hypothetical protein